MNRRLSLAALAVCLALIGAITFDLFAPWVVSAATADGGHVDVSTSAEPRRKPAKPITNMEVLDGTIRRAGWQA
ncbi:MAG TPA: hypothetical protein VK943_12610 [Arenibaculum sp.]|nr:hypothetical protein [Arenibaculum sp.]